MLEDIITGPATYDLFGTKNLARQVICSDGTELSVKASSGHYCSPRSDNGPYASVEVGYPSVEPPSTWAEYMEGNWETDNRIDTVYGYVPVDLVREFVRLHGGERG